VFEVLVSVAVPLVTELHFMEKMLWSWEEVTPPWKRPWYSRERVNL